MNVRRIADSTGEIHRMADLAVLEARHKRHQRSLARKRKGGRRREKQRWRAARAARRLANARKNWQHHVSKRLAGKAHTVVMEDLKTKNMIRSAKGTKDNPGKNVRAKAGLNREIRKTGWSSLRQKIEYRQARLLPSTQPTRHRLAVSVAWSTPTRGARKQVSCAWYVAMHRMQT